MFRKFTQSKTQIRQAYQIFLVQLQKKNSLSLSGVAKDENSIAFNKEIIKAMKKGYKPNTIFKLGSPFGELAKYIPNYEIVLTGKVLTKSMTKDKDHQLNWGNYIDLPFFLNNPTAIFKSETIGYVVLTEVKDVNNKPVMISLHINEEMVITNITSLYVRNYEAYKRWIKENRHLYINKKSDLFNYTPATIAIGSNKSLDKDTKKGLKKANTQNNFFDPKKFTSNLNKNSLAYRLQNKANAVHDYYIIPDKDIAGFLGNVEKKNKESVAITIAGGQGSMKTRLCFQLMNCFAQNYKVGHASIEEHPESAI